MILEKTVEVVKQIYLYHKIIPPKINKVVIGLGYTAVELHALALDPIVGLAYTLPNIIQATDCSKIDFAGDLTDKKLFGEVIEWSYCEHGLKKIIGIAALNAVSQHIFQIECPYNNLTENLIDHLKINNNSRIIFVGNIRPLVRAFSQKTHQIIVIEENQRFNWENQDKFPIFRDLKDLKEQDLNADVLICSGTSVINDSLENILNVFRTKANYIILLGPTASFIPDILFDKGVNIVGGFKVIDSNSTLQVIQEGGGTKLFSKYGTKYNLVKSD